MSIHVTFKDGIHGHYVRYDVMGACLAGEPTVYVYRAIGTCMRRVYVKPVEGFRPERGESPHFVEA